MNISNSIRHLTALNQPVSARAIKAQSIRGVWVGITGSGEASHDL